MAKKKKKEKEEPQTIVRWVSFTPPYDIRVCCDPACAATNGDIKVDKEGAIIIFLQTPPFDPGWRFHDVTIHPMGPETDRLKLKWVVTPFLVKIFHEEACIPRTYSYTIAIEMLDKGKPTGTYVYLDPQMVDTGGRGG